MDSTEKNICRLFSELDETRQRAVIATIGALVSGAEAPQAIAAGNRILVANGYEPVPLSAVLDRAGKGSQV